MRTIVKLWNVRIIPAFISEKRIKDRDKIKKSGLFVMRNEKTISTMIERDCPFG